MKLTHDDNDTNRVLDYISSARYWVDEAGDALAIECRSRFLGYAERAIKQAEGLLKGV